MCAADYESYDLFLCMDRFNVRNALRIFGSDPKRKVGLLLDYAHGGEVDDPWYSGRFDVAYRDILQGCEGLLKCCIEECADEV